MNPLLNYSLKKKTKKNSNKRLFLTQKINQHVNGK